ncbi:MAG TPA: AAA family ATPase, partial [Clostridia bacterium]|nr:AAA family ATPase [Clostridia bacterium]
VELFGDILGISEFSSTPVRQLSLGQRMRADLCASLLHNPDILYLDEPTIGLDVVVKEKIREFIKEINRTRQTTVILTTHDMSDIEQLCRRVMVIDHGNIVYDGDLDKLKSTYGSHESLEMEVEHGIQDISGLYNLGVSDVKQDKNKIRVAYDKNMIKSSAVIKWMMENTEVMDFTVHETKIDEVIRTMYREQQDSRNGTEGSIPV